MQNITNSVMLKLFTICFFSLLIGLCLIPGETLAQQPGQAEKAAVSGESEQWRVMATSPGVQVVSEQQKSPGKILSEDGTPPKDAAYNWLMEKGLEEGRNVFKGKLLYISVGSAPVNATPAHKDYIDSRYLAFQRAELEAKAKTAISLGIDLTTERGSSEREINPAEREALRNIYESSKGLQQNTEKMGVADQISRLFKKTARLAEAKLDQSLKETGVDIAKEKQQEKAEKAARRDRMKNLRSISGASVKAAASAFAEVQGTQVIQSFEGFWHNNYQAVVITLWSKNLERMVKMMENGSAPNALPKKRMKKEVAQQLPDDDQELACLTGVRAFINQRGEHVLLSFGQAGVEVIGGREDIAYERADDKARLRAMAGLRNFMGERVAFSATEELRETLALYADSSGKGDGEQAYHAISRFDQMVQAEAESKRITGVYSVYYKELKHPFTERPMVFKVLAWSPESQAMAQDIKQMIEKKSVDSSSTTETQKQQPEAAEKPLKKGTISSGEGADMDAW